MLCVVFVGMLGVVRIFGGDAGCCVCGGGRCRA